MKIKVLHTALAFSTIMSSLGALSFILHANPVKFSVSSMNPQVAPENLEDYLKTLYYRKHQGNSHKKLTEKELDAEVAKALKMAEKNVPAEAKEYFEAMKRSPEKKQMFRDMVRDSIENPDGFFGIQSYSKENKKSCSDMIILETSVQIKPLTLHVLQEAKKHNRDTIEVDVDGKKIQVIVGAKNIQKAIDALSK